MSHVSDYEKVREEAHDLYIQTKPVYSPALGEMVYFSAKGFNHLRFKKLRLERDRSEQAVRFKVLEKAIMLIGRSTTYQEFEVRGSTLYWGIIAIIGNQKIKVVLKKAGNGMPHFWSVMPAWKTSRKRDIKFVSTMSGNPEVD